MLGGLDTIKGGGDGSYWDRTIEVLSASYGPTTRTILRKEGYIWLSRWIHAMIVAYGIVHSRGIPLLGPRFLLFRFFRIVFSLVLTLWLWFMQCLNFDFFFFSLLPPSPDQRNSMVLRISVSEKGWCVSIIIFPFSSVLGYFRGFHFSSSRVVLWSQFAWAFENGNRVWLRWLFFFRASLVLFSLRFFHHGGFQTYVIIRACAFFSLIPYVAHAFMLMLMLMRCVFFLISYELSHSLSGFGFICFPSLAIEWDWWGG